MYIVHNITIIIDFVVIVIIIMMLDKIELVLFRIITYICILFFYQTPPYTATASLYKRSLSRCVDYACNECFETTLLHSQNTVYTVALQ